MRAAAYLTYALNKEGDLVHIDDVPNGNDCGCICPHCKSKLCAKNNGDGEKMIHHFAHQSGADCVGAVESVLHIMAKNILHETKCIYLPNRFDRRKGELYHFDRVEVEFYDKETQLRPDCVGYNGEKYIWVEFKRSHEVDTKKREKIISAMIDCIEIDLNGCTLDPEIVREFITNSIERREWITDVKVKKRTAGYNSDGLFYDYRDYMQLYLPINRTFAKEENGRVVHLFSDNYNPNAHSCYCLACGQKVVAKAENTAYCFVHVEDNNKCRDELYLHEAAKEILYNRFCDSNDFTFSINQIIPCKEKESCQLSDDSECVKRQVFNYDLKKYGYDECLKDAYLPNRSHKCDLVFKRKDTFDNAIIVSIASRVYDVDIDIYSEDNRMILFRVDDEDALKQLRDNPIDEYLAFFRNFKVNSTKNVTPNDINRKIKRFVLFNNGKYHMGYEKCSEIINRIHSNVYKIAFTNNYMSFDYIKIHALYKCYNLNKKACYCELCHCCVNNGSSKTSEKICTLYEKHGTPYHPLQSWPIDCPHFSLDNYRITRIENEAEDVEELEINNEKR